MSQRGRAGVLGANTLDPFPYLVAVRRVVYSESLVGMQYLGHLKVGRGMDPIIVGSIPRSAHIFDLHSGRLNAEFTVKYWWGAATEQRAEHL